MTASPNLKLPFLDPNQSQKTVTHNAALSVLDALVNLRVASTTLQAPPASLSDGQRWIVASGGTGAWLGKDLNIAAWQDGAWNFYAPNPGFVAYVDALGGALMWNGSAWVSLIQAITQLSLNGLGLGTAVDASNPLSAKLNAALFSAVPTTASPAGTGDVRVKLSKQATGNTASLLFQDNFSSCAEIGLAGDDNVHVKVSPDGSTFYDAMVVTAAGGSVAFLGTPTHPTPAAGDNSTKSATTAFVAAAVAAGGAVTSVAGRTGAVTLAVGDVTGAAPLASPALTGTPTVPTAPAGTNTGQVASTAFVAANFVTYAYASASYATSASPTLTGTPSAPTPAAKDNSTKLATTAYADRAVSAAQARTQVADAAYTVLVTDRTVAVVSLTAARTLSLPAASAYPPGATLTVMDESGACSATNTLTVAAAGSDTIDGAASAVISTAYGYLALQGNTSNKWTVIDAPSPVTSVAARTGAIMLSVADVSGAAPLASPALTGTPTAPNAAAGTNTTQVATTSFVAASFVTYAYASATYATLANASLTGTPTAPTPMAGDNSTKLATTAYADRAASAGNLTRKQVADAAYTIQTSDRVVAVISLTAARILTLPAASAYPQGATLTVVDESGACSATSTVTVARASSSDAVNGGASAVLATPYGYLALQSNGSNKWTVVDQPSGVVASLNGAALAGFRNRLINGNFAVNQRAYASNTALSAGTYAHDRWKAGSNGCTYTFTAGTPDTTVTITAGTLQQVVEPANIEGGVYTLSWTGTATGRVVYTATGASSTTTTAYAASPIVLTGVNAGLTVTVELTSGTLGLVQCEPGPISTPFERRGFATELALCQRYYFSLTGAQYSLQCSGYADAANRNILNLFSLPVTMRTVPSIGFIGSWNAQNCTPGLANATLNSLLIVLSSAAAGFCYINNPAAGGFYTSAEL